MTNRELERRLAGAVSKTAPNDLEGVLSRCETRKGNVIQMTPKKRTAARSLVAACLALVLVGGGAGAAFWQTRAVASVISLDVNPSIELKVNAKEKVISCESLNEEARAVLAEMKGGADLEGAKLNVAVNALVGALVRRGYLDSISSAILISVEDRDQIRADRLRQELTAAVDGVLQEQAANAAVLSQTVEKDAALEQQARENSISTGKAALIRRVMALNGALPFEALSALSVEELKDLAESGAPALPIGQSAARAAAETYAGTLEIDAVTAEVDAELDDMPAHYEVELRTQFGEFEYIVDAYTGEILRGTADILNGGRTPAAESKPATETASGTQTPAPAQPPSAPAQETTATDDIGAEKAKAIALAHAGLTEGQASRVRVEKDRDDGRLEYEVDFRAGDMEYEYTIDAATGAVLEHERDRDD